jgi:hypothetical protein
MDRPFISKIKLPKALARPNWTARARARATTTIATANSPTGGIPSGEIVAQDDNESSIVREMKQAATALEGRPSDRAMEL